MNPDDYAPDYWPVEHIEGLTPADDQRWCDEWEATAAAIERARALPIAELGEFVSTLRDIRALPEDN